MHQATFRYLINAIFLPYLRKFILVFFDDILIYNHSWEALMEHMRLVFQLLQKHQLFLKQSKCQFAKHSIHYLEHLISAKEVCMDPTKISSVQEWPQPKNLKSWRGFLGMAGYYCKFVKGFGTITHPLTESLKKEHFIEMKKRM